MGVLGSALVFERVKMKTYWCQNISKDVSLFSPLNLTEMRKDLNLDQIQCAHFIGVTVHCYRSWENGNRNMPDHTWKYFRVLYKKAQMFYHKTYPNLPWPPGSEF